jgi:hypothetical protein
VEPFLEARRDGGWKVATRSLTGQIAQVAFTGERRWWGGRWVLTSTGPFPVAEEMIVFASRKGMDHGFWRDIDVGDGSFDHRYFLFSDLPALLPMVLGRATRTALEDHAQLADALELYVRGGLVRVHGSNTPDDATAIARHLAIHAALARDRASWLESWQQLIVAAHGRAHLESWPPTATIMSRTGTLAVHLSWDAPTTRDGADWDASRHSLRTHVRGHDDRERRRWSLREAGAGQAATHELAGRRFVIFGQPSFSLPAVSQLLSEAPIVALQSGLHVAVTLRGIPSARHLEASVRMIERLLDPAGSSSPYR